MMTKAKTLKLKNITKIQMGRSFRSRIDEEEDGAVSVVQMKDLTMDNIVDDSRLIKINEKNIKEEQFLKKGNLIFRSRGQILNSSIVRTIPEKSIVAAPLFWITINDEKQILPEFLNWYMSELPAQAFLNKRTDGTFQKTISKRVLEDMDIPIISYEKQRLIIEFIELSKKEEIIFKNISHKRKQVISQILIDSMEGK